MKLGKTDDVDACGARVEEREGLTIERYSEVMAHVQHFPRAKKVEVIVRLGLTGQQWEAAVLAWTRALAEESAADEEGLSRCFGMVFAETKKRLKKDLPALPSIGLLPEERAAAASPELPSLSAASPTASAPEPSAREVDLSRPATAAAAAAAAPITPAQIAMLSLAPMEMGRASCPTTTQCVVNIEVKGPALPFQTPSPATSSGTPERAFAHGGVTGWMGGDTADISSIVMSLRNLGNVLPFLPATGATGASSSSAGLTGALRASTRGVAAVASAAADVVEAPTLSLKQYASLCVELTFRPVEQIDSTLQRYHLTREQHVQLEAYWQGRMAADPLLRAEWQSAYATYLDWLRMR